MNPSLISLESIQIASPCRAAWDAMQGNDCVRFCPSCGKNVYNLSAMTREQAERLIARKEGTPCVRMRRRSDGTVLTNDCPIGVETRKRQRRGVQLLAGAFASVAAFLGLRGVLATYSQAYPPEEESATRANIVMGDPATNPNDWRPRVPVPDATP